MTTIAVKDGIVAADSQSTAGFKRFDTVKIRFVKKGPYTGYVFGGSGKVSTVSRMLAQVESGEFEAIDAEDDEGSDGVAVLVTKGRGYRLESSSMIPSKFTGQYAIGSGESFAMGAMLAGKSAAEAVKIAAKLDTYTGGPVRTLAV